MAQDNGGDQFIRDVFPAELEEIRKRRKVVGLPAPEKGDPSPSLNLVGLALSGGGIRSATFSLGVIQALAKHGVLKSVDYLSTVSGGGYIGSCLSTVLCSPDTRPEGERFPLRSDIGKPEPNVVGHLRNSSNYLAPRGFIDRMRIPTIVLRGIVTNFLLFLAIVMLLVFATELVYEYGVRWDWPFRSLLLGIMGLFVVMVLAYPFVARLYRYRSSWAKRDRAETLFTLALLLGLALLVAVPVFLIVDLAIQISWTDARKLVNDELSYPFQEQDAWKWLVVLGAVLLLLAASQVSEKASGIGGKILLAAVGLLGPAILAVIFLVLVVLEVNPLKSGDSAAPWYITWWDPSVDPIFFAALGILVLHLLLVDVNLSSAHRFYRDRLSKAFLVQPDWTGDLTHKDSLKLSELNAEGTAAPYHLINAALNLQGSPDPSLRGRNAGFFVFSKHFTGARRTGYLETKAMETADPHLNLGTAMAISGAAAAPNMGAITVRSLVFLMTLLNVRLGYWLPNPAKPAWRDRRGQWLRRLGAGAIYLFYEALGRLHARGTYVNVSDGGHLENLGLFELLRRRCRLIVAVDGEADPHLRFGGLAKLILYARIDLGIRIRMTDLDAIRQVEGAVSERNWTLGEIDYGNGQVGQLLYIKSSNSRNEREYVRSYREHHPDFPHESTADQFFDEIQFEAYRSLGYTIADEAFSSRGELGSFASLTKEDAAGPAVVGMAKDKIGSSRCD